MPAIVLLDDVDADTTGTVIFEGRGSSARLSIMADDFGGGTVEIQLQRATDSLNRWNTINPNGLFVGTDLPAEEPIGPLLANDRVRAVLSGATSPSNVRVEISDLT